MAELRFNTLEGIPMSVLTNCFNSAFSDYVVPVHASDTYLSDRWVASGKRADLSVGVFDGSRLVAFIMHSIKDGERLGVYNGGTGVIPAYRGQRLVQAMYAFIEPILRRAGVQYLTLEVITQNEKAIRAYQRVGFTIGRTLRCFSGRLKRRNPEPMDWIVERLSDVTFDWRKWRSFWDFEPAWEQNQQAVDRSHAFYEVYRAAHHGMCIGYLLYRPDWRLVVQYGVAHDHRRRGVGSDLFRALGSNHSEIRINNVDVRYAGIHTFFDALGFVRTVDQYEMQKTLI